MRANVTIANNKITGCQQDGIYFMGSRDTHITGNTIVDCGGYAVNLKQSGIAMVQNNLFQRCQAGVNLYHSLAEQNVAHGIPITQGLGPHIELPHTEMYGEPFDIPTPDKVIFISWFAGGEVFRSGATWTRGKGKIFYFRPGHETFPIFYNPEILKVIENAVRWAAFAGSTEVDMSVANVPPLEDLPAQD